MILGNGGKRGNGLSRIRTAAVGMAWSTTLAIGPGTALPAFAAEVTNAQREEVPNAARVLQTEIGSERSRGDVAIVVSQTSEAATLPTADKPQVEPSSAQQGTDDAAPVAESPAEPAAAKAGKAPSFMVPAAAKASQGQMATFQLPQSQSPQIGIHGGPPRPATQFLKYQYSYGTESDITYRLDPDLNRRVNDDSLILAPQLNGYVLYRPSDSLEMMLEMILEREIAVHEEDFVTLPNGETQVAPHRRFSLLVDQAYLRFKTLGPFDVTVGRRNFEDDRHWLYDTSMDAAHVRLKLGDFQYEASAGREAVWDLDLLTNEMRDRIDTYMLYVDYRGIEDHKLAGYAVIRDDQAQQEGRPLHLGVRAQGAPSDSFNYWTELALLRGHDASRRDFSAHAFDIGGTYRFLDLPLYPSVSLGYAYATGDGNPDDNTNHEFRQTGLQSNEGKLGGVSKFKYYGEALDPELSNLRILTAGVDFRPAANVYVDLVYHRYWLDKIADEVRNWALTAQMNQDDTQLSKDAGNAFDIVLGLRNVFGVRRLGVDLRAGWLFPGKAFRNEEGDPADPTFRRADKGFSMIVKFWW